MQPSIVIIGAGFAGICAAVQLRRAGHTDVTIVESSDGVGGVWRHNTYPGAACDVPAHLYSYSFAPNPAWQRRYATQPEILAYLEGCVDRFGLRPALRLGTEVTDISWDDQRQFWCLALSTSDPLEAQVVISAVGQLNRPAYPAIPGIDSFEGPAFHSARWRHDVELRGRRVGVLGTGASAIQFVPHVAEAAGHSTVFQRTPPHVIRKHDRRFNDAEQRLYHRAPAIIKARRLKEYVVHESRAVGFVTWPAVMRPVQRNWEKRLADTVADPSLRDQVTPSYLLGCKRLLLSNDWYDVLQRPDVDLVNDPIETVTPNGIRLRDGRNIDLDVIVFGTGFATQDLLTPMRVTGRDGLDLHEQWRHGASAFLGISVSGFPNFFLLYGPGTNVGHTSVVYMVESQIEYVRQAVEALAGNRLASLELRDRAQSRWDVTMRSMSARTVWESGCESWYTDASGHNILNWPGYSLDYRRRTRQLDLSDYTTVPAGR